MSIEYATAIVSFRSAHNAPIVATGYVDFPHEVLSVKEAAIKGFTNRFSGDDDDHPLHEQAVHILGWSITAPAGSVIKKRVEVKAELKLRDASEYFDDYFEGDIHVLVIAETKDPSDEITSGYTVLLRASNGKFLTVGSDGKLLATGTETDNDLFTIELLDTFESSRLLDRNLIAMRATANGKLVCSEGGGGKELVANRDAIGPWETFMIRKLEQYPVAKYPDINFGDKVALRANSGPFVCAEGGGDREVVANRWRVGRWETFIIWKFMV
ncbi:MAG TPA: hypothetical protein VK448_04695 [Dissulfurispiraceae bacterium]|nr:hypothetical protein [Dissulfurispiraceae bacterium]